MSTIYKFRVGTKNIGNIAGGVLGFFGYNHACLLLDRDLFEYGANEPKSYQRHKNVGRDTSFDWNLLGTALNGTTRISPDQLETAIKNNGSWGVGNYNALSHNCHDFVKFCLDRIGCPSSMLTKLPFPIGPCFMKQTKGKVHIRSVLANKNLDISENKIQNGTPIILFQAHGAENQIFNQIKNSDGTYTFGNKNFAIDVRNGEAKDGTIIQIWEKNGTASQKFYLVETGLGDYTIHSAINPAYVIDVKNGETHDCNTIQLWKLNLTLAQRFKLLSP